MGLRKIGGRLLEPVGGEGSARVGGGALRRSEVDKRQRSVGARQPVIVAVSSSGLCESGPHAST